MPNRSYDDDSDYDRPSGGVGPSSIAYESPRRKPGRRRLLTLLVAAVALGGFIGIVWHAYNQGKSSGGDAVVPLITAEDSPTKVRPDQPGGMDVPNQDKLIYDRLGREPAGDNMPQVERLLPPPETPVARPAAPEPVPVPARPEPQTADQPAAAAQAPANSSSEELQPPPLAARPSTPPAMPQASQAAPTPVPPQPAPAPAQAQTRPAPTPQPQQAATLPAGAARIQLGAVRSSAAAQKEWARLQNANKDLLGGLSLNVVQANLGDRGTYYRIQAGPAGDASDLCAKLKARNVGCIVVR